MTVALAGLTGCGGDEDRSGPVVRDACGTTSSPLQRPSTSLTYRGAGAVAADVPILCDRLDELGSGHRVRVAGRDRLVIDVPRSVAAAARALARPGRLVVYDWERNVIGPRGRPAPFDPRVTGGAAAGQTASATLYDAVLRASRRPARA
ncbi:MAG: hypothetical protein LC713_04545, partial [Actinobacteria bacterium]|nr:hypothetical protein [Actinomycetota bacterium]